MKKVYNFIFKNFCLLTIVFSFICLAIIFTSIISKGYRAFYSNYLTLNIELTPDSKTINETSQLYYFYKAVNQSLNKISKDYNTSKVSHSIISSNFNVVLSKYLKMHQEKLNKKVTIPLLLSSNSDTFIKKYKRALNNNTTEQINFLNTSKENNLIRSHFNWFFFSHDTSGYPELAGIKGALKGSFVVIILTLCFSFIIGLATAIYIEEFLKKGTAKSIIEININNLASIPSIIYGLLGLSIFQNILGIPHSSPLLASMVLTLMILPNVIVYSQIALSTVPSSIKEAAYGIGASKNQVIFNYVVPFSLPGIITGLIIGLSRAIGESAPLLIIGMFVFIANGQLTITGAASTLPTQILMWFNMPEVGFTEKTSAAIIILLIITITINLIANYIRKKFTKKL